METTTRKRKRKIKLVKSAPKEIHDIFNYVIKRKIPKWTTLPQLRKLAEEEYLPKLTELTEENYPVYVKTVEKFKFDEKSNYLDPNKEIDWRFLRDLTSFKDELLILTERKYDKDWDKNHEQYRLIRQVSPPPWAYEMVPFCKDIIDTGRSFGLLFD